MRLSVAAWCLVGVLLAGVFFAGQAAAATAHLTLQSQPGDFIGQGGNYDITYDNPDAQVRSSLATGEPAELLFVVGQVTPEPNTFALLFFGTNQLGIPMQPGTYTNAERADFASPGHPGLDVSFQNRGSNTLTGSFTVTDATFSANHTILSFSASFEQHSEGATPALFGTFTYAVPEPGSSLVLVAAAAGLLRRRRAA